MVNYWSCRADRPIHASDLLGLTHLYQPIVGTSAIALYVTLSNQLNIQCKEKAKIQSHALLRRLLAFSEQQLLETRYLLEGVGLLNTYQMMDEEHREYYEYELIPPLTPKKFFQSDVLSLALYRELGREKFVALREELLPISTEPTKQRIDVTKSFQEVFTSISPKEIAQYAQTEQGNLWMFQEIDEKYSEGKFPSWDQEDLSSIRMRIGSRIKDEEWTEELQEVLREIRFLYQLDDWGLYQALQNPEVTQNGKIDLQRLKEFVREEYHLKYGSQPVIQKRPSFSAPQPQKRSEKELTEEEKHFRQLEQISPIELLSFYQDGAKIPDSDLRLVESLMYDYRLPHGVINVLLEYVLYKNDYKLPKALVQKIAGHWKRLRITTVQEASAQARKENWELRKKGQRKTNRTKKRSHPTKAQKKTALIPQAVAEQMEQENSSQDLQTSPDWLAKRKRINEKLALWEQRKKRM